MKKLSFSQINSVYLRVVTTFILILIPMLMVGVGIYSYGIQSINNSIGSSIQAQNDTVINNLENDIRRIKILQYDIYNDENLLFLMLPPTAMDFYNRDKGLLRLQQRLGTIKSSSRFIKEVKVYIPPQQLMISTTTSYTVNNMPQIISELSKSSLKQVNYFNSQLVLSGTYPASSESNDFAIEIDLSNIELRKMLQEIDPNKESGSFIFSDTSNFLYSSSEDLNVIKEIKDKFQAYTREKSSSKTLMASSNGIFIPVKTGNSRYLAVFTTSKYLDITLVHFIPEKEIFRQVRQFQIWLWILAFTSLIIIIIFSFSLHRFIHRPLNELVEAFRKVKTGDLSVRIQHKHMDEFKYIYESFNSMVDNLHSLIEQSYKNKILAQKAELKQLQSQINPHFLYNSFFILQKRIKYGDNENALIFAERLGEFFKFVTRSAKDEVPLSKEVEHARIYSEIQAARFSRRITVQFDELPHELENIIVPRVIMQPIIENAFEHSLEDMEENGKLVVGFEKINNLVLINIENNGEVLAQEEYLKLKSMLNNTQGDIETTGLVNIHRRLKLKFGDECGIRLVPVPEGGLNVTLILKKEEG
ncbi:MAG TPA: histidine kinase [Ruminiclostridium sp.]|nr:histidine kinase [Ruminiclostridium sp.]